jgi:hypothetical protein
MVKVLVLADRLEVALPAARALSLAGHVVGAATSTHTSPVLASRAVTSAHIFPGTAAPQEAWNSTIRDAITRHGYDVVLACSDVDVVRLLAAHLNIATVPRMTDSQTVVLDKAALVELCAGIGVTYPETYVPRTPGDDAAVAKAVSTRVVVKAARPAVVTSRGVIHVAGGTEATNPGEVMAALERYRVLGLPALVQKYVAGQKLQAVVVRRGGVTSARLVALVERTPAETTLRHLDSSAGIGGDCIGALERVVDAAGYQGLLQAEFLWMENGDVCLVDLNPRLWGGLSFAELMGLRITERAVYDALGVSALPLPAERPGRRYHHFARELTYMARRPREVISVVSQWSREDAWDRPLLNDFRPHVVQMSHVAGGVAASIASRGRGAVRRARRGRRS